MKTIVATIKNPADGDLVILEYSSPRGGVTSVKHTVLGERTKAVLDDNGFVIRTDTIPAETPRDIAASLSGQINKDWMHEAFEGRVGGADNSSLIIGCTGLVEDVRFKAVIEGAGGTTVDVVEY